MTQKQNYSYLDLTVHPALAPAVLSPDVTVLFNHDLRSILWANAAGAKLFGGKGVVELLDANLGPDQPFVRQLRDAINQMGEQPSIVRGFRISQGLRSALLQFEIFPVEFADNNRCYKVVQASTQEASEFPEHILAKDAVESMIGFADAAAILDDYGLPIAASQRFGRLGPTETDLAELVAALALEEDRLIKRPVTASNANQVIAGLGRISENPGRCLVVLADTNTPDQTLEQQPSLTLLDESQTEARSDDGEQTLEDEEIEPTENTKVEVEIEQSTAIEENRDPSETTSDIGNIEDALPEDDVEREDQQDQSADINDTHQVEEEETETSAAAFFPPAPGSNLVEAEGDEQEKPALTSELNNEPFSFVASEENTRFAWSIDETGYFTHVSPELAETVGPNAADVLGRKWDDVATIFGFDTDGTISALLTKHDTWSGKTVLWPVESTDMVVPIDLAALPAFGAERSFEGFKGFGIIRTLDSIVDPEETGLALSGSLATANDLEQMETSDDEQVLHSAPDSTLWFEAETQTEYLDDEPEIQVTTNDDAQEEPTEISGQQGQSNIYHLVPKSDQFKPRDLTPKESEAFRTVGNHLKGNEADIPEETPDKDTPAKQVPDTSLLEKLPVAILIYRNGETLFANQRMIDASGYANLEEIDEAGGVDSLLRPPIDDNGEENRQYSLVRANGELATIYPVLHSVPWDDEKALQLSFAPPAASPLPIPDAIEMTQVSEIQSILDTTSDGIMLLSEEGNIISINASAEALFNRKFDDVTGTHFSTLFTDESHGDINQYLAALAEPVGTNLLQEGREVIAREANGGLMPVFLTIAKLESSGKLCAVVKDLTSWKKTEQELVKSRRDAERANEQKSDFLAQVSHEVRTPLNAIIGFSDIMIEERFGPIENERYREYLRDINRSGKHVLELVNDLLDLSKIEAGKLDLTFDAVSLNEIVAESVAMLQPHANTNRIIVRTSLSRSVPKVVADVRSIRQVVLNLVTNAIKFSDANSQVIVSTVYESSGEVALRVRDTGKGMSEHEIKQALKPYHQLHKVSERTKEGTGLGLPLTKALVEANRAFFDLESVPGEGTIAHVQFPIQRVLAD